MEQTVIRLPERGVHAKDMPFAERMEMLKNLTAMEGIRLPATRLPEGTRLWEVGENAKRALKTTIQKLPEVLTALMGLRTRVEAEAIVDIKDIPIQRVRMSGKHEAGLFLQGGDEAQAMGYTRAGFGHFAQFIRPPDVQDFVGNALACKDPFLRANWINHFANRAKSDDKVVIRTHIPDPENPLRVIRAVTSTRHSLETGDDLAVLETLETKMASIFRGAKARITRELDHSTFEIIWPAMDRELVVGDIAYIGVRITNSETKAFSLKVEVFLLRVLCANFTTAFTTDENEEEIVIKHLGDLRTKLPGAFEKALKRADPFVKLFTDAYQTDLPEFAKTRGEILERVRKAMELPESTMQRAGELWDADGKLSAGDTLAGLVNAMTRASQQDSMTKAGQVEAAAGKLIANGWALVA